MALHLNYHKQNINAMKTKLILLFFLIANFCFAQDYFEQDLIISDYVEGTLLIPNKKTETLVIIIPGSGPTDRDGNQNFVKNNSLKFLAEDLTANNIATFRYDKRALTMLKKGATATAISKVRFDDFVEDAKRVVTYFKRRNRYQNIYVLGHSQGSLVAMLASDNDIAGVISLSGAGNSIDAVIMDQLKGMGVQKSMLDKAQKTFNILKEGKIDKDFSPHLANIFNLEVQPFMMSWIKYDPKKVLASLNIPTLIINGDRDIQVSVDEAKQLKEAKKDSQFAIIKNMNHVLKTVETDSKQENMKTYNMQNLKNNPELLKVILHFIKK